LNLKNRILKLELSSKIKNNTRDIVSYGVVTIDKNNPKINGYVYNILDE